jgi:DNA replication protein DnaC
VHLLVLDDLGTQNATPWAEEKIFQIINFRYLSRLPTVITTNVGLEDLDGRISSRLQDADRVTLVRINAPDYRAAMRENLHPLLSTLELHAARTFDSFNLRQNENLTTDERDNLAKGLRRAQAYAENPHGWLLLMGDHGSGKTHLAAAIANAYMRMGNTAILVPVADLLDELRATYDKTSRTSYDSLFEEIRKCPLLILDDLGTVNATPWALEKLRQIFNYRSVAELPTVITTTLPMEKMDPALAARMLNGQICTIFELIVPPFRVAPGSEKKRKPPRGKIVAGS